MEDGILQQLLQWFEIQNREQLYWAVGILLAAYLLRKPLAKLSLAIGAWVVKGLGATLTDDFALKKARVKRYRIQPDTLWNARALQPGLMTFLPLETMKSILHGYSLNTAKRRRSGLRWMGRNSLLQI